MAKRNSTPLFTQMLTDKSHLSNSMSQLKRLLDTEITVSVVVDVQVTTTDKLKERKISRKEADPSPRLKPSLREPSGRSSLVVLEKEVDLEELPGLLAVVA